MWDEDVQRRLLKDLFKSWSELSFNQKNFIAVEDGVVMAIVFHAPMNRDVERKLNKFLKDEEADSFDRTWMPSLDKDNNNMSHYVSVLSDCFLARHESSQAAVAQRLAVICISFLS